MTVRYLLALIGAERYFRERMADPEYRAAYRTAVEVYDTLVRLARLGADSRAADDQ